MIIWSANVLIGTAAQESPFRERVIASLHMGRMLKSYDIRAGLRTASSVVAMRRRVELSRRGARVKKSDTSAAPSKARPHVRWIGFMTVFRQLDRGGGGVPGTPARPSAQGLWERRPAAIGAVMVAVRSAYRGEGAAPTGTAPTGTAAAARLTPFCTPRHPA